MRELLCGVDMGGTKLAVGLVTPQGEVINKTIVYGHSCQQDSKIMERISGLIVDVLEQSKVPATSLIGIGLGFPGHIRYRDGVTITSSNLDGFKDYPIRQELQSRHETRVVVDNDANAQALAEFKFGAGVGYDNQVFITISSGIGAGVIANGKIYRGATGTAGEVGHMIVEPQSKIKCRCGNYGCLMSLASGIGLKQIWQQYLDEGYQSGIALNMEDKASTIDGIILKKGLESGDELAKMVVEKCAEYIGIGLYNVFQLLNPGLFVLGGGLSNLGDALIGKVQYHFQRLAQNMMYEDVPIKLSQLGEDAGLIGAASLLLEEA